MSTLHLINKNEITIASYQLNTSKYAIILNKARGVVPVVNFNTK